MLYVVYEIWRTVSGQNMFTLITAFDDRRKAVSYIKELEKTNPCCSYDYQTCEMSKF